MNRSKYIGVIGAGSCSNAVYHLSEEVGYGIGKREWVLVCGGLGGVMEGAAKGCMEAGGLTIGLLPGLKKEEANPYIRVAVATGLNEGRNLIVVRASDLLISVSGGYGTLSEIALALKMNKPVVGIRTWPDIAGIRYVESPSEAFIAAEEILSEISS